MTYTEAIEKALKGNQQGFEYLYQSTYKNKLYLAVKYMGNLDSAQDVLQDAYIKAFSKLDTLLEPEKFPVWLGQIVVNTAKNTLIKKTPLLFSEITTDDYENNYNDFDIVDNLTNPAIQYSVKETQELVHELIDTLSSDQKMCILMYYIEGLSVNEIATTLECSENTVKSRLNYGRKHIKAKVEELQKKGYKLYSIAPLPLLLLLLSNQEQIFAQSEAALVVNNAIYSNIIRNLNITNTTVSSVLQSAVNHTVAKSISHGLAVKIASSVIGVSIIVGGITMVIPRLTDIKPNISTIEQVEEPQTEEGTEQQTEKSIPVALQDEQYETILQGGLTKDEFEFALAAAPTTLTDAGMDEMQLFMFSNYVAQACDEGILDISILDRDIGLAKVYLSLNEFNNYISVLGEEGYSKQKNPDIINGDSLCITIASAIHVSAEITNTIYTKTDLYVEYIHSKHIESLKESVCTAHLKPNEQGLFEVVSITEDKIPSIEQNLDSSQLQSKEQEWKQAYKKLLNEAPTKTYPLEGEAVYFSPIVQYGLAELNGDNNPELVLFISDAQNDDLVRNKYIAIYTYQNGQTLLYGGEDLYMPELYTDGKRLVLRSLDPMNGNVVYSDFSVVNGIIETNKTASDKLINYGEPTAYETTNQLREFETVSSNDLSLLR